MIQMISDRPHRRLASATVDKSVKQKASENFLMLFATSSLQIQRYGEANVYLSTCVSY